MNCPSVPEINISDLSATFLTQLGGRRYPLSGLFELTERCNLNCVHCYINQAPGSKAARKNELSTDQVKNILDQMAASGTLYLTLSGGEALLRKDFTEIYQYAKKLGMLIGIFTNGTLINADIADMLANLRPHWIDITLYGATRETYEEVTRVPGSFNRCMRGIALLRERDLPIYLKTSVLTINVHELSQMQDFAGQLGTSFRYDGLLWPRLDGDQHALQYQLSPQALIALEEQDPSRLQGWCEMADKWSGTPARAEYVYSCGAGLQSFHIDSGGQMSMCTMSRKPAYSLLEMSFQEAWEKLGDLRKEKRQMETPCQTCTLGALCSQCPGWSQAVHGDNETPVAFLCELAHLREKQVQQYCVLQEQLVTMN